MKVKFKHSLSISIIINPLQLLLVVPLCHNCNAGDKTDKLLTQKFDKSVTILATVVRMYNFEPWSK